MSSARVCRGVSVGGDLENGGDEDEDEANGDSHLVLPGCFGVISLYDFLGGFGRFPCFWLGGYRIGVLLAETGLLGLDFSFPCYSLCGGLRG
ncbi:hypothetical protein SUGI_0248200 [Cryptomeria japonica]|nr:hypothetical protein SUGI_0248200 [Cryptomeria japonica]